MRFTEFRAIADRVEVIDQAPCAIEWLQSSVERGDRILVAERLGLVGHGIDGEFGFGKGFPDVGLDMLRREGGPADKKVF